MANNQRKKTSERLMNPFINIPKIQTPQETINIKNALRRLRKLV